MDFILKGIEPILPLLPFVAQEVPPSPVVPPLWPTVQKTVRTALLWMDGSLERAEAVAQLRQATEAIRHSVTRTLQDENTKFILGACFLLGVALYSKRVTVREYVTYVVPKAKTDAEKPRRLPGLYAGGGAQWR